MPLDDQAVTSGKRRAQNAVLSLKSKWMCAPYELVIQTIGLWPIYKVTEALSCLFVPTAARGRLAKY
jgi:hypothetical protein